MAAKPKLTPEQWASTRATWEGDPRKPLPWLIQALDLPVSTEALRLRAKAEGWAKLTPVGAAQDSPEDDQVVSETPGRPTIYRPQYADQARNYCLLGATDAQMAEFFEVSERTINRWKAAHPEFSEALRRGKSEADALVAESLYKRATGCSHPDTHVSNHQGEITLTPITKHYPPDVQAATFWLKNRQPTLWKERVEVKAEIKGDPFPAKEVLDAIYAKAMIEAAQVEAKLAGRRERLGIVIGNRDAED